jgi:hypothetical protein
MSSSPLPSPSPSSDDLAALADDLMRDMNAPSPSPTSASSSASIASSSEPVHPKNSTPPEEIERIVSSTPPTGNNSAKYMSVIGIVLIALFVAYILNTQ